MCMHDTQNRCIESVDGRVMNKTEYIRLYKQTQGRNNYYVQLQLCLKDLLILHVLSSHAIRQVMNFVEHL